MVIILLLIVVVPKALPIPSINDKLAHAIMFFFLALFYGRGLPNHYGVISISALILFGLVTEFIQYLLPWRSFSLFDWLADIVGILSYHLMHTVKSWLIARQQERKNVSN